MKIRNAQLHYSRILVGELEVEDEGTVYVIKVNEKSCNEIALSSDSPIPEHIRALALNHVIGWTE
jgi:hypothetical protein